MELNNDNLPKEKLWTSGFINLCIANFLLFFAFYILLPILPIYLIEVFNTDKGTVGLILSSYTLAALFIRPISGFILDMFNRKPIYLLAYFLFISCFIGYIFATVLSLFIIVRIFHGLCFGMVTTAGNSLVVDIMPASRRGEGLGYFGVANNLAMAMGPMLGLFIHDHYNFNTIFYTAIISGVIGILFVVSVKSNKKVDRTLKQPIAFDRFFLPQGLRAGIAFLLSAIPYGILTSYVAIYGAELNVQGSMGIFFSLMAVGLASSRLFAGKLVDRGRLVWVISLGTIICIFALFLLSSLGKINIYLNITTISILFYTVGIVLGFGYGMMFPAYNTLFVNLAPNNRRATASSTYLTSWDIGIGIGLVAGGKIADTAGGLPLSYLVGAFAISFSLLIFRYIAGPHFEKNKLR